jgi:hypothetical protein
LTANTIWDAPSDEQQLLVKGILPARAIHTAEYETEPYIAMVRMCARRVAIARPDSEAVTATSERFYRQLGVDCTFHVASFPHVIQYEPLGTNRTHR